MASRTHLTGVDQFSAEKKNEYQGQQERNANQGSYLRWRRSRNTLRAGWWRRRQKTVPALNRTLGVQSRSVVESAMLMLHCGRPYGTDSSRQRQDHARRPSCYTAIEGFDPRARQPL